MGPEALSTDFLNFSLVYLLIYLKKLKVEEKGVHKRNKIIKKMCTWWMLLRAVYSLELIITSGVRNGKRSFIFEQ